MDLDLDLGQIFCLKWGKNMNLVSCFILNSNAWRKYLQARNNFFLARHWTNKSFQLHLNFYHDFIRKCVNCDPLTFILILFFWALPILGSARIEWRYTGVPWPVDQKRPLWNEDISCNISLSLVSAWGWIGGRHLFHDFPFRFRVWITTMKIVPDCN